MSNTSSAINLYGDQCLATPLDFHCQIPDCDESNYFFLLNYGKFKLTSIIQNLFIQISIPYHQDYLTIKTFLIQKYSIVTIHLRSKTRIYGQQQNNQLDKNSNYESGVQFIGTKNYTKICRKETVEFNIMSPWQPHGQDLNIFFCAFPMPSVSFIHCSSGHVTMIDAVLKFSNSYISFEYWSCHVIWIFI